MSLRIKELHQKTCHQIVLILSILSLVSCGFHLRGKIQLSEQALPVYIVDSTHHDLTRKLSQLLQQSNIKTTTVEEQAASVITISDISTNNRAISVDTLGRPSEYLLTTIIRFELNVNKERFNKSIRVSRDVAFDANNILSFKKEEKTLYDEMLSDGARLIVLQLQSRAKLVANTAVNNK